MKKKNPPSHSSSLLRYTFPIMIIVLVFLIFGSILFHQRKQELNSLELRLQMQASLLGEKISSKLHIYEMTIALLDQIALGVDIENQEERTIIENSIKKQLLLQEGLEQMYLYSIHGHQLYSSSDTNKIYNDEIRLLIENNHMKQKKEFAISPFFHNNKKMIMMSKILNTEDHHPNAILALVIETDSLFDPFIISMFHGTREAALYDSKGEVFALWQDKNNNNFSHTSTTNISQLPEFSKIPQLEQQESSVKGGVRILSTTGAYIPLAQIDNFPFTVALHVDIPTVMSSYDGATYINLVAIFILLAVLLFINHRLNLQRNAKETLQQHMVDKLSQQVKQRTAELEKLSSKDTLTGLINRRQLNLLIDKELARQLFSSSTFSIIAIDLDGFKQINDTYGHVIGDEVLIHTANQLSQAVGEYGYVSRWGGDELMILLPDMDDLSAHNLGIELCSTIEKNTYKNEILCTISIGVAQYRDPEDLINLIRRADTALYKAKELGKNRAILAT